MTSRGAKRGGSAAHFHAVVIAEVMGASSRLAYPLSPITPSTELPFALLPICNTPLIDYTLENLISNGVNEVTILVNPSSYDKVFDYLQTNNTARGRGWLSGTAMKVSVVATRSEMRKFSDASDTVRERNLVPQDGASFLFVPMESVAFFTNLRELFELHNDRKAGIDKYAATIVCLPRRGQLDATLHNVIEEILEHEEEVLASPLSDARNTSAAISFNDHEFTKTRTLSAPARSKTPITMISVDAKTLVVSKLQRFEKADHVPEMMLSFDRKRPQTIRTDLAVTDFLFCSCDALPLIDWDVESVGGFLDSLISKKEVLGNVFGIAVVDRPAAIIDTVNSLDSYLQANLDVCGRRLFPFTRESCFAEAQARYALSSMCETVYLHTAARASSTLLGPNVVVGENVLVPSGVELVGTVCGRNTQIGKGSSLTSCVVMEDVVIGEHCILRGCVIGQGAVISNRAEIVNCVIGPRVKLGQRVVDGETKGVIINKQRLMLVESDELRDALKNVAQVDASSSDDDDTAGVPQKPSYPGSSEDEGDSSNDDDSSSGSSSSSSSSSSSDSGSGESASEDDDDDEIEDENKKTPVGAGRSDNTTHATAQPASATEDMDNDEKLLGQGGLGRTIPLTPKEPIAIAALFMAPDTMDDDDEDSVSPEEELDNFFEAVSHAVQQVLHSDSPKDKVEACASKLSMDRASLRDPCSYGDMSKAVTEELVYHVLSKKASTEATLASMRTLFGLWCRPFYHFFLSKMSDPTEYMSGILEGVCNSIADASCVLFNCAPLMMEMLFSSCDPATFAEKQYCVVNAATLVAFDKLVTRLGKHDDLDDAEKRIVLMGSTCRTYITNVKAFVEAKQQR